MTGAPTTIDLGILPHRPDQQDDPPAPDLRPGRAWLRRWSAHRTELGAAVMAGLLLFTAHASTPDQPWPIRSITVPAASGDDWIVFTDQQMYMVAGDQTTLSAYRLADGQPSWEIDLPQPAGSATVLGEVPVLQSYHPSPQPSLRHAVQSTVLDPDTGQERWSAPGHLRLLPDGRLLLREEQPLEEPENRLGAQPAAPAIMSYTAFEADGTEVWRMPATELWTAAYGGAEAFTRLVTLAPDGRLSSYDTATGSRLASTALPEATVETSVFVADDLVIVQPDRDEPAVAAYDMDTLDLQWTADLAPPGTQQPTLVGCGPVVCVSGPGQVPAAIDPATGNLLWTADWLLEDAEFVGDQLGFLYRLGPSWPPGYLYTDHGWLVELDTGEPVLDLAGWTPWLNQGIALTEPPTTGTGNPLVLRYDSQYGEDSGVTWLGEVRFDPPRIQPLGSVPSGEVQCLPGTGHLACQDEDEIQVWRIG